MHTERYVIVNAAGDILQTAENSYREESDAIEKMAGLVATVEAMGNRVLPLDATEPLPDALTHHWNGLKFADKPAAPQENAEQRLEAIGLEAP